MILITGASGLLGFHLVNHLQETVPEQKIRVLVRSEQHATYFNQRGIATVMGDILDIESLKEAFEDVQYVFHCAALVSFHPQDRRRMMQVNVDGTANIVNLCLAKGVKKLCHVSSVAALGGSRKKNIVTEKDAWEENNESSYYGYTKHLAELEVRRGEAEGLSVTMVNPSVILGPMRDWQQSSMKLFRYVADGNRYYSAGRNNFVDVRDVSQAMTQLTFSELEGEQYIVAGYSTGYKELFEVIAKHLGVRAPHTEASPLMMKIVRRVQQLTALLGGKKPLITAETLKVAKRQHQYSSEKLQRALDLPFHSLEETVSWTCAELKSSSSLI